METLQGAKKHHFNEFKITTLIVLQVQNTRMSLWGAVFPFYQHTQE
jgi:hypothetical protein